MFSQSQQEAICHKDGPCLTLAGPGSGKTTVLTYRIQALIYEGQVPPEEILVITFTKAAALEMKKRFQELTCGTNLGVNFGTFHSIFYHIILNSGHIRQTNILMGKQKRELLVEACSLAGVSFDDTEFYDMIIQEISLVHNSMKDPKSFSSSMVSSEEFLAILSNFQDLKKKCHMLDFDDMMTCCYELLLGHPEVLAMWQQHFKYLLIDETQDMNPLQFEIIKLLAFPDNNIFAVGDDDQSIYGFRGAAPEIMMNFSKEYPGCKIRCLQENYRSGSDIVKASLQLIGHNTSRYHKEITPMEKEKGHIYTRQMDSVKEECALVLELVEKGIKEGVQPEEIAVLFRTNTQALQLMERLTEQGISFYAKDKPDNPFSHWVAKDLISYLRISVNLGNRGDFLRVCNRPVRYISRAALDASDASWQGMEAYYRNQPQMIQRMEEFRRQMVFAGSLTSYGALNYIRQICYDRYLESYAWQHHLALQALKQVEEMLMESAREYDNIHVFLKHIEKVSARLEEERRTNHPMKREGIGLYTLHSAKGLEFHTVIILDVNEGIMPSKKALSPESLEEERRMFYVGVTRAKQVLYLLSVKNRNNQSLQPSRYLEEMLGTTESPHKPLHQEAHQSVHLPVHIPHHL